MESLERATMKNWIMDMRSHKSKTIDSKSDDEAAISYLYQQMIDGWNEGTRFCFI
jgi:hypothetical protein